MDAKTPIVSVGMPVFNGGRWLRGALDALLAQTYTNFELIISDNASSDDTEVICREYEAKDGRLVYRRNTENVGATHNYNAVFHYSRGEYFKWASCNDICMPSFIAKCVEVLDARQDVVLVYPRTRLFSDRIESSEDYHDGLDLQEPDPYNRFKRVVLSMRLNNVMNGLIRAEALRQTPLLKVFFASDVNLMAELSLHGKFVEIPEYLFYRRMDSESATKFKSNMEVLRFYDPSLKNLMLFEHWKIYFGHFAAVARSPLSFGDKACVYRYLVRMLIWDRWKLIDDVVSATRVLRARWLGQRTLK